MKNKFLLSLILGTLTSISQAVPLFCADKHWQLKISSNRKEAALVHDGQKVEFGDLVCSPYSGEKTPGVTHLLSCVPATTVADAGFVVTLSAVPGSLIARLSEISFAGTVHIADLGCVTAAGSF